MAKSSITRRPSDARRELNALRAVAKAAKRLRGAQLTQAGANTARNWQREQRACATLDTALAKLRPGWRTEGTVRK